VGVTPSPTQKSIDDANKRLNNTLFELEVLRQKNRHKKERAAMARSFEANAAIYCFNIKLNIGTLESTGSIYLDELGKYRSSKWDKYSLTYEGKRTYLDDNERSFQIKNFKQEYKSNCKGVKLESLKYLKSDPKAGIKNLKNECKKAKSNLEKMKSPKLRLVDDDLKPYNKAVQLYCKGKK